MLNAVPATWGPPLVTTTNFVCAPTGIAPETIEEPPAASTAEGTIMAAKRATMKTSDKILFFIFLLFLLFAIYEIC
jgi:hypothetical protein